jgi:hypothetical protein
MIKTSDSMLQATDPEDSSTPSASMPLVDPAASMPSVTPSASMPSVDPAAIHGKEIALMCRMKTVIDGHQTLLDRILEKKSDE